MVHIWDPDDGGLFLWRDELNNLNVIEPEYNKMIFNSNKISHSVTMITPFSEQLRYTVQIFFKSN
jgi:Rps23 Pro-64 3,4-dihydroxylase Tpa1-like proline 4-hydroxylase